MIMIVCGLQAECVFHNVYARSRMQTQKYQIHICSFHKLLFAITQTSMMVIYVKMPSKTKTMNQNAQFEQNGTDSAAAAAAAAVLFDCDFIDITERRMNVSVRWITNKIKIETDVNKQKLSHRQ